VDNSAFSPGAFAMTLNFGTGAAPTVSLPDTQVLNAPTLVGGGGIALEAGMEMELMEPGPDPIPLGFFAHGGDGYGSAVRLSDSALGRQQQQFADPGWSFLQKHEDKTTPTATLEIGFWETGRNDAKALAPDTPVDTAFWRDASEVCFGGDLEADL